MIRRSMRTLVQVVDILSPEDGNLIAEMYVGVTNKRC